MARFFTSDPHFFHRNVIKYCNRPWATVEEMNAALIERWNSVVTSNDEVIMLGDISFASTKWTKTIFERLNGDKFLVRGNHDSGSEEKWSNVGVILLRQGDFCLSDGTEVNLSHFPYKNDTSIDARYTHLRLENDGKWLLHGHVHQHWKIRDQQINVGVDVWNYTPVSEQQILQIIHNAKL